MRSFLNLQQMTEVTRCSCWHQNFILKGLSAPASGLYTCIKSCKKLCKIRLERDFFKVTRGSCWHQNFVPWECLPLTCGYFHVLNHEKMCIKSEVEEIFLNLQQMTIVMRPSCWHQNIGPNGLSAPTQWLCLNFFSSITADFNISSGVSTQVSNTGPMVF